MMGASKNQRDQRVYNLIYLMFLRMTWAGPFENKGKMI